MLSKEEQKAIELIKQYRKEIKGGDIKPIFILDTAKNLITKLQKENETTCKLNANMSKRHLNDIFKIKNYEKQIDLMAEEIRKTILIVKPESKFCQYEEDCKNIRCKDCIKQFFEKQARRII